jgi:hypothetical protein
MSLADAHFTASFKIGTRRNQARDAMAVLANSSIALD